MSAPRPPRLVLLLLVLLLPACTLIRREDGRPVPAQLPLLEPGVTTKAQALQRLGAPWTVERQFDGDLLTWRWRLARQRSLLLVPVFTVLRLEDGQDGEDRLALLFDREGLLVGQGLARDAVPAEE